MDFRPVGDEARAQATCTKSLPHVVSEWVQLCTASGSQLRFRDEVGFRGMRDAREGPIVEAVPAAPLWTAHTGFGSPEGIYLPPFHFSRGQFHKSDACLLSALMCGVNNMTLLAFCFTQDLCISDV